LDNIQLLTNFWDIEIHLINIKKLYIRFPKADENEVKEWSAELFKSINLLKEICYLILDQNSELITGGIIIFLKNLINLDNTIVIKYLTPRRIQYPRHSIQHRKLKDYLVDNPKISKKQLPEQPKSEAFSRTEKPFKIVKYIESYQKKIVNYAKRIYGLELKKLETLDKEHPHA
jgi:hypothetical protein